MICWRIWSRRSPAIRHPEDHAIRREFTYASCANGEALFPEEHRVTLPGSATYLVDPVKGDDANPAGKPWKTYGKLNSIKLAPGDRVIVSPGTQTETLMPSAAGTREKPVTIQFLPGVHTIASNNVKQLPMFVSNSQNGTDPKPVGILLQNCRHLRLEGGGVDGAGKTTILYDGRMVQIFNDHSEALTFAGLVFDLRRPMVSGFRVLDPQ